MLQEFSYYLIFGRPLIMYLGIVTIVSFLITASIPLLRQRGVVKIPFVWHMRMAGIAIALGLIHGVLGIAAYF
jgi:amino acid permease